MEMGVLVMILMIELFEWLLNVCDSGICSSCLLMRMKSRVVEAIIVGVVEGEESFFE